MPRSSNNYSSKKSVSSEVKNISAKRLFRGVMDCVRKLDTSRQHRRNLISLFQAEQVKMRQKLRDACERLMFSSPTEYGRKAEEVLWKKVYYDVIHAVKAGRKFQSNAPGTLQQRHLEPHYRQFLYSAIGFYHHLLLRLQSKVKAGVIHIDFPLTSRDIHHSSAILSDQQEKEWEDWVRNTTYRVLVCLGDLSRYQMEFGVGKCRPIRYYQLSLLAKPGAGMPHNQLATIAGHNPWWGLTAAYHYCRSLHAEMSFEGAEGNLQKLFDRNKKLFYQLPTNALDGIMTAENYKKEHTRIFIISFLYLCDLLRPKTYATDVETSGLCKRLIDALQVCLNNMDLECPDDVFVTEDFAVSESFANKQKSDSKRYGIRHASVDSGAKSRHHHPHQHRLNGDIVFKICIMCLVNVHDLQNCRSNRSSAAIAFALAFFSHLLGYLTQQLASLSKKDKDSQQEGKTKETEDVRSKADGDNVTGNDGATTLSKSKKSKSRMRRRRRVGGSNEDDLSEGEEDVLGGGDAAGSDSEPSGTEEEDDSDTLSESSGSENRLSQEELSSQEEEESVENEFFTPQKSKSPVPNQSPPSIAVASLQDLSNKMFQPPNRRKIMLAPSFLQNLTPIKDAKPLVPSDSNKLNGSASESEKNDESQNKEDTKEKLKNNSSEASSQAVVNGNEKKMSDEEKQRKDSESFAHLQSLCRYHHVMAAVKLLSDWLTMNEAVVVACAKISCTLWSRLVCLLRYLPSEKSMLNNEQIRGDIICSKQIEKVIEALEANREEMRGEERAREEAALKEAASADKKIKIEKRKATGLPPIKKPNWQITTALPEDHAVHQMKAVKESAVKTGVDLTHAYDELTDLQQVVIRTCRLRHLCRFLSTIEGVEINVLYEGHVVGDETFTGPQEEEVVDPQMELEAVEAMRKARLMKDMAASRLRNEVQALETSLGAPKTRDSAMCLFIVPDTDTLCSDLSSVRRLVASERFFVVIAKTVIDGLDSLKKDQQGARDAIRYLEAEFKKSNRFIRAQAAEEQVRGEITDEKPKLRRHDLTAWRLYRLVECCRYLMHQEAKKNKSDVSDHNGLVAILTKEQKDASHHIRSALNTAKSFGIQVASASTFVQSWSKSAS